MANNCFYTMAVSGYKDNVNTFANILQYKDPNKIGMYRIFSAKVYDSITYGLWKKAYISGDCAWSVACCMLPGPMTYFNNHFSDHFNNLLNHKEVKFLGTNCLIEARRLNLTIEIYSKEGGVGFCESIKILPNGTYARNLCGEYESWWIDEFPEYKNFVDYCFDGDESQAPFSKNTFDDLRDCDIPEWEKSEYQFDDTIPNKPKYLAKNRMYHLTRPGEKHVHRIKQVSLFPNNIVTYLPLILGENKI